MSDQSRVLRALRQDRPFGGLLGDTTELALAQHLIATRELPYSQGEIAELTGYSRQAIAKALRKFGDLGVVKSVPRGPQVVYFLDEASPVGYAFDALSGALIEEMTGVEVLDRPARTDGLDSFRERELAMHEECDRKLCEAHEALAGTGMFESRRRVEDAFQMHRETTNALRHRIAEKQREKNGGSSV